MQSLHVKYLLVGGGLAGSSAAEAIRRHDATGSCVLIGQEVNRPYHRPPLSKQYLRREQQRSELTTLPIGWFPRNNVELRTGRRVAQLDTARRCVTLDNGEAISFDKLLLCTGASAAPLRVPGAELPNLFYVRTIDDVDRLQHALDTARNDGIRHARGRGRVAVIGGGVLGVELVGSLTQMGLAVELIVKDELPWNHFAGENTGRFVLRHLEAHGVKVHLQRAAQRLEGDGRVQRVVLTSNEVVECDVTIAAVGAVPNRELIRGTPIAAETAILVDQHCETNVEGIFAAGDCAAVFDPLFGKHRIIDHWDNARLTGRVAGSSMAGVEQSYSGVSFFSTEVLGLELVAWGEPRLVDRRLTRGSIHSEAPDFAEVGIAADGRVAQVLAIGRRDEHEALRRFVAQRLSVEGLEERIKDPSHQLEELLRSSPADFPARPSLE